MPTFEFLGSKSDHLSDFAISVYAQLDETCSTMNVGYYVGHSTMTFKTLYILLKQEGGLCAICELCPRVTQIEG